MVQLDRHSAFTQSQGGEAMVCQRVFKMKDAQRQRVFDRRHKQAIIGYKLEQTSVFARLGRCVFSPPMQMLLAITNLMRV